MGKDGVSSEVQGGFVNPAAGFTSALCHLPTQEEAMLLSLSEHQAHLDEADKEQHLAHQVAQCSQVTSCGSDSV